MKTLTWYKAGNDASHLLARCSDHLIITRCGLLLDPARARMVGSDERNCSGCVDLLEDRTPVHIQKQGTRHGLVLSHSVTVHGLHILRVGLYDRYPDLEVWAGIAGGQPLSHNYIIVSENGSRLMYSLVLYWRET